MKSTTQKIRFILILVSFLLFPITIYYFSPASPFLGILDGIININLFVFATQFISAIFLGRGFCGWICPGSGITDICLTVNKKPVNRKYFWIKYIVWIPWILSLLILLIISHNPLSINLLHERQSLISILEDSAIVVYYSIVGTMVLLSLTVGKHSFCHHICWMGPFMIIGTKLGRLLRIPRLELHFNSADCNQCGACSIKCPMSIDIPKAVKNEIIADSDCTLCAECIDVCKKNALKILK